MDDAENCRTLYISNLSHRVNDELIYELFLQAGPIENCSIVEKQKSDRLAIIKYKHSISVPYAKDIFDGTELHGRVLNMSTIDPFLQPTDYGPEGYYAQHRGRYDPYQRNADPYNSMHPRHDDYSGHYNDKRRNHSGHHNDFRRRNQPYQRYHEDMRRSGHRGGHRH